MRVNTETEAWSLAERLLRKEFFLDEEASASAGYKIYRADNENWISALRNRLEVNYEDGSTENIWIDSKCEKEHSALVGLYTPENIFGNVKLTVIQEEQVSNLNGFITVLEDDEQFIVLSIGNSQKKIPCAKLAYIKLL